MAKHKFPKQLFVLRRGDVPSETFYLADEEYNEAEHGERVAIYELKNVCILKVDRKLEGGR